MDRNCAETYRKHSEKLSTSKGCNKVKNTDLYCHITTAGFAVQGWVDRLKRWNVPLRRR